MVPSHIPKSRYSPAKTKGYDIIQGQGKDTNHSPVCIAGPKLVRLTVMSAIKKLILA